MQSLRSQPSAWLSPTTTSTRIAPWREGGVTGNLTALHVNGESDRFFTMTLGEGRTGQPQPRPLRRGFLLVVITFGTLWRHRSGLITSQTADNKLTSKQRSAERLLAPQRARRLHRAVELFPQRIRRDE